MGENSIGGCPYIRPRSLFLSHLSGSTACSRGSPPTCCSWPGSRDRRDWSCWPSSPGLAGPSWESWKVRKYKRRTLFLCLLHWVSPSLYGHVDHGVRGQYHGQVHATFQVVNRVKVILVPGADVGDAGNYGLENKTIKISWRYHFSAKVKPVEYYI